MVSYASKTKILRADDQAEAESFFFGRGRGHVDTYDLTMKDWAGPKHFRFLGRSTLRHLLVAFFIAPRGHEPNRAMFDFGKIS